MHRLKETDDYGLTYLTDPPLKEAEESEDEAVERDADSSNSDEESLTEEEKERRAINKAIKAADIGKLKTLLDPRKVNTKDDEDNTFLHKAALLGNPGVIRLLLDAKADRTATNNAGETPHAFLECYCDQAGLEAKQVLAMLAVPAKTASSGGVLEELFPRVSIDNSPASLSASSAADTLRLSAGT